MRRLLLICAVFIVAFVPTSDASAAQNQRQTLSCDRTLVSRGMASFKKRKKDGKALAQAERDIKEVLQSCPDAVSAGTFQAYLRIVEEETGQRNLFIALFYLHADGRGLLQGALSRLKTVYEKYPAFSRRDQVIYLLGELSVQNGKEGEGIKYYQAVVSEFPNSKYATLALQKLKR